MSSLLTKIKDLFVVPQAVDKQQNVPQKTVSSNIISDGWSNALTGMGIEGKDNNRSTRIDADNFINEYDAISLYMCDGIAHKILTLYSDDMTREGFCIEGDTEGFVEKYLDSLDWQKHFSDLTQRALMYGGAVMLVGANDVLDSNQLIEPLDTTKVTSIDYLKVFDRWQVALIERGSDPADIKTLNEPIRYHIVPIRGTPFTVHASRLIRMNGPQLPDRFRIYNLSWGLSIFNPIQKNLRDMANMFGSLSKIVSTFVENVYGVKGFEAKLASPNGRAMIEKQMALIDLMSSVFKTKLIDKDETMDKKTSSVNGLADLFDRYGQMICASTGAPFTLVFGRSPAGLNATGDSDIRIWYDKISSLQKKMLKPGLKQLVKMINNCDGSPYQNDTDDFTIKFNPLWQTTKQEELTCKQTQANIDVAYVQSGVLMPEEIATSRFGGDHYSYDITLMTNDRSIDNEGTDNGESETDTKNGKSKDPKTELQASLNPDSPYSATPQQSDN